jgi:hypothetical protein
MMVTWGLPRDGGNSNTVGDQLRNVGMFSRSMPQGQLLPQSWQMTVL